MFLRSLPGIWTWQEPGLRPESVGSGGERSSKVQWHCPGTGWGTRPGPGGCGYQLGDSPCQGRPGIASWSGNVPSPGGPPPGFGQIVFWGGWTRNLVGDGIHLTPHFAGAKVFCKSWDPCVFGRQAGRSPRGKSGCWAVSISLLWRE